MSQQKQEDQAPGRRDFLKRAAAGTLGIALGSGATAAPGERLLQPGRAMAPVATLPQGVTRPWLGAAFWSNRLQDWRLHDGRLECLRGEVSCEVRTVGLLTREIVRSNAPGHISVETGVLGEDVKLGFCGLLNRGGYVFSPAFVNMVQRTQTSHNPDPYDATPAAQGLSVYYSAFRYGGVSFALVEDRKFKSGPPQDGEDEASRELLGERQERFLGAWAEMHPGLPKVCLSQTCWACVMTGPDGTRRRSYDSNGYPSAARDRALRLVRDAGALMLAGDQHLATVVRHGVDGVADGPMQFSGPAGASFWQRWFAPARTLPNGRNNVSHTGDFEDAFGNSVRVEAVANPKISFAEFRQHIQGTNALGDRSLKSEGYGLVRVQPAEEAFAIECWPWDEDPRRPDARQFAGWPYRVSFDEAGGRAG